MTSKIFCAGFGGQGILFAGKVLAYKGLKEDKQVSWLPSYGPEMRGGTANCSVTLSDEPIGSPIFVDCDVLIVMNLPSLDKYESMVKPGGKIFIDSTLIERKVERDDVTSYYVPATDMAREMGVPTLANMVLVGKMLKECPEVGYENAEATLNSLLAAKHADMYEANLKAMQTGYGYDK